MAEAEANLKLIMEDGPLAGQTFDFVPGSKVQIGRIVRGNSVTIKDAGVSSKHLLIHFEPLPGLWMISDLDSSNGTFLNGCVLDPFDPAQLSDGDVVKIGEVTSITVKIGGESEECLPRRNTRRRGRNLAVLDEDKGVNVGKLENNEKIRAQNRRGRVVSENCQFPESENVALVEEEAKKVQNPRQKAGLKKTRSKKNDEKMEEVRGKDFEEMVSLGTNEVEGEEKVGPIRVLNLKKENVSGVWEISSEDVDGGGKKEEQKEVPKRTTRGRAKKESLKVLDENIIQTSNVQKRGFTADWKGKDDVSSMRITRSMRRESNIENVGESVQQANNRGRKGTREKRNMDVGTLVENVEDVQMEKGRMENVGENLQLANNRTRKGTTGKRNMEAETLTENVEDDETEKGRVSVKSDLRLDEKEETREYNMPVNELVQIQGGAADKLVEKEHLDVAVESFQNVASSSRSKDRNGDGVDLEKMSASDWFDSLEVDLPKQITDATEQMICDMRQISKKFHKFILQQKNAQV